MLKRDRNHGQVEQLEGAVHIVVLEDRCVAGAFVLPENIGKAGLEGLEGSRGGEAGDDLPVDEVKSAQIVDAVDMVGVGMGEQDRVDVGYPFAQGLTPQIGGGVHQDGALAMADQK